MFQGLEHIKDHAEVSLNDLSIAGPQPNQPALKGVTPFTHRSVSCHLSSEVKQRRSMLNGSCDQTRMTHDITRTRRKSCFDMWPKVRRIPCNL